MCFSASVSLITGSALVATGIMTVKKSSKEQRLIGYVPLIFGVQQLIEGGLWLTLKQPVYSTAFTYGFLFLAYFIWPIYVPIAVMMMEPSKARKNILKALAVIGACSSIYLFSDILANKATAIIANSGSLAYIHEMPYWQIFVPTYVIATCGACFVSSNKLIQVFGALLAFSMVSAAAIYTIAFTSVWCFFAAFLSLCIGIGFVYQNRKKT